jgi:NAD(P)H-hydrate epimerase
MKCLTPQEYEQQFSDRSAADASVMVTEDSDLHLPAREKRSHKYSNGRALIIAGSEGYSGAPVLAANACERSGAGLTRLIVPRSIYSIAAVKCDGSVVTPLDADRSGAFSARATEALLPYLNSATACLIGPGLGLGEGARALVSYMLHETSSPLILDADALTVVGKYPWMLENCHEPMILTPHEGEFERLGGDLSNGRLAGALSFSEAHESIILVLKGHGTLVCQGGQAFVNPTGSPALAKGGTGDVLAGVLCALLAQGIEPLEAARSAVYLHGFAGDLAEAETGPYSLTPSDVIRYLPKAFCSI